MGMAAGVSQVFPTDKNNTPLGDIPAMSHFKKLSDIELCISLQRPRTRGMGGVRKSGSAFPAREA